MSENDEHHERQSDAEATIPTAPVRWWVVIPLMLVLLLVIGLRPLIWKSIAPESVAVGKPAPQFDLVRLSADLQLDPLRQVPEGKVTLLHFWGTWCGPCKMEYPHLAEMAARFDSTPQFRFVPVTCEYGSNETFEGLWSKTADYFHESDVESIAFADPRGVTRRSAADRLQRNSLYYPTSILIDARGTIAGVWEGYSPTAIDEIADATDRLIAVAGR